MAIQLEGLSEETTCFVSMSYFSQNDRFADFIVHEAAHIFHNCKRETIGLPHTRTREWLLEIDYRKRETFAYACEAYSRVLELSNRAPATQTPPPFLRWRRICRPGRRPHSSQLSEWML